jgi:hypothetical protein
MPKKKAKKERCEKEDDPPGGCEPNRCADRQASYRKLASLRRLQLLIE